MEDSRTGPFIIGFNGPPRSGKDTLATAVMDLLDKEGVTTVPVHRLALAATMRNGAAATLGMNLTDRQYSEIKDQPLPLLNGGTFRQFMIDMSEIFVKEKYGRDFWSRRMYEANRSWWNKVPSILIVTDIGFREEVNFFCQHSKFYLNVVLDRKGTDFSLDSRNYVWVSEDDARLGTGANFCYSNNHSVEEGAKEIARIMYKFGFPVF
jgi:hypothetical protein